MREPEPVLPSAASRGARALAAALAAALASAAAGCGGSDGGAAPDAERSLMHALAVARPEGALRPGDALRFPVIVPDGGELVLGLAGRGRGALEVAIETPGARARERSVDLDLGATRTASFALPPSGDGLVAVRATFRSDDADAELAIVRAGVRGAPAGLPIVFVSLDTLSARRLDLYGHARETAPNLTRFAREAVVFERCWTNAPWTVPSYMSQWSGLLPWSHRTEREGGGYPCRLAEERVTLAEAFLAAGYRTAAFVDNPHLDPGFGFAQGFEVYDLSAAEIPKTDHSGGARKVFADGLAWLDGLAAGPPWLLMLQALDVHGPYAPSGRFRGAFAGDGLGSRERIAPVCLEHGLVFDAVPRYLAEPLADGGLPEAVAANALADAYDEEILQLDDALGRLFEELEARGVLDSAVVVVSSDHGESLDEGASLFSHVLPYEPVVHVPLIVRLPGGRHGGRRIADPVQLVDLYPTLLELAGVPYRPPALHGRSLVAALEGGDLAPVPLVCQGDLFEVQAVEEGGVKLVALEPSPRHGVLAFASYPPVRRWLAERLSVSPDLVPGTAELPLAALGGLGELWALAEEELCAPRRELYRVPRDPAERSDLSAAEPAAVRRLEALLERARAEARAARATEPGDAAAVDPAVREALRDLGYAGDGR